MKYRFTVGDVAGNWHYSDWIEGSEIQESLDEAEGCIGTDPSTGREVYVDSVDEAMEFMCNFLKFDEKMSTQVFNMNVNGRSRSFNVRHIVFWELTTGG